MGKADYAFKSKVLNEHADLIQKAKTASLYTYAINQYKENGILMPILERSSDDIITVDKLLDECVEKGLYAEYHEAFKINKASYQRVNRLRERVADMLLSGDCLFLTLTFTDETLKNTSADTRRKYVSRYLKNCDCKYVANIDFGSKNHREHYHALVSSSKIDFTEWHKFGAIDAERVRNRSIEKDRERLSKYICKLSNHAIKETTRRSALLYSR